MFDIMYMKNLHKKTRCFMSNKIILKAEDLDGYLTKEDQEDLKRLDEMFKETMKFFEPKNEAKIIEG